MTQTIDPVFSSAVLSAPELALNDLDFDTGLSTYGVTREDPLA